MGMVQCPDCGKSISDQAPTCPGCGRQMVDPRVIASGGIYCRACAKDGRKVVLIEKSEKAVPGGAHFVAVVLLLLGLGLCLFTSMLVGIIPILIAILIWSLGAKDIKMLKCPECKCTRRV